MTDGRTFSLPGFAIALVTVSLGTAGGLVFIPFAGSYVGLLLGGLVAGIAVEDRTVLEAGVAGVFATLGILVAGAVLGSGIGGVVPLPGSLSAVALLTSVVLSFAVGAFGGHFGDDIRDGLTEPVETPPTGSTDIGSGVVVPSDEDEESRDQRRRNSPQSEITSGQRESTKQGKPAQETERTTSKDMELERE